MNQKIMKTSIVFIALFLSAIVSARPSNEPEDEYFDFASYDSGHEVDPTDYVEITSAPKKDIYYPQETIQAECKVTGMPIPTVEWVQGTEMRDDHDFDTNSIVEMSPTGIATVVARLIIKPHHVKPGTTKTFTCVGRSGAKVVKSSTTVHFTQESKHPHVPADEIFNSFVGAEKTRIYQFIENVFENQGTNVMLPCKASAKASIYWINDSGKQITGKEPRFKILPTGDLIITSLQFQDMGTYICIAKNAVSKDVVSTFIYPMAVKQK